MTRVVSIGAAIAALAMLAGCGTSSAASAGISSGSTQSDAGISVARSSSRGGSSAVVPAADSTVNGSAGAASEGNFDENPTTKLPDSISSSVPDNATVVSRDYAQKKDGTVVSLKTGAKVTDPTIVGTQDTPPDPLAISDGKRFIPVSVSDTKKQMAQAQSAGTDADSGTKAGQTSDGSDKTGDVAGANSEPSVTPSADFKRGASLADTDRQKMSVSHDNAAHTQAAEYQSNPYGAHWGTSDGQQSIYSRTGRRVLTNVLHGVDVSQFQSDINWGAAKNDGVQAAVVRLGYGVDNIDPKAAQNTGGVRGAGLTYGFYWYSYAYDSNFARQEAESLISTLHRFGIQPGSTSLPIYYDLEAYAWSAHPHPTSPSVYHGIVQTWIDTMRAAGYTNVAVYSYTSYLNTALNDDYIHSQTSWVAQYAGDLQYTFSTSNRSWQYADSGRINGIPGNVDLDAFDPSGSVDITKDQQITVADGTYYIIPASNATASVDVPGGSTVDSTGLATYSANGTVAQQFKFNKNSDGSYTITNVHSGKVLDVAGAVQQDGTRVQQYTSNGTNAQRWYIRQGSTGAYYVQSALGNWALGTSGTAGNSTPLEIEMPQDVATQRFLLSSPLDIPTGKTVRITSALSADRVVDISNGSLTNGAAVESYSWNATPAQQFVLQSRGNSVYSIKNQRSGKMLDVVGGATNNSTPIDQYSWNGTQAQLWVARDAGSGFITFYNPSSGKVLEIPGGSTALRTQLRLYSSNGTEAQKWKMTTYTAPDTKPDDPGTSDTPDKHPSSAVLPDGVYRFESASDRSRVMEDAGGSRADRGNIDLYRWNGTEGQKWRVKNLGGNVVTLTNVWSGKLLDLSWGIARNGQNIDQYAANGTQAQKWHVVSDEGGFILQSAVNRRFVIDLAGNITQDGSNIDLYSANSTSAQTWYPASIE